MKTLKNHDGEITTNMKRKLQMHVAETKYVKNMSVAEILLLTEASKKRVQ